MDGKLNGSGSNSDGVGGKGVYPGSTFISEARQGYDGGNHTYSPAGDVRSCGGGGGAGAVGTAGTVSASGHGGSGLQVNIDGNNYYYAGGGGGGV